MLAFTASLYADIKGTHVVQNSYLSCGSESVHEHSKINTYSPELIATSAVAR
jgi:hypothetical protein